ncbi:hypothetical protein K0M31_008668 [Melipona bicolor]|uniref:Uncharacterized protein n=1 Tax=Melipona bicolor TaxID=60889 RepID=A0AA40KK58_9HYME|nr:hypothetical protein K0M31_008668 [Melipona bicolor]
MIFRRSQLMPPRLARGKLDNSSAIPLQREEVFPMQAGSVDRSTNKIIHRDSKTADWHGRLGSKRKLLGGHSLVSSLEARINEMSSNEMGFIRAFARTPRVALCLTTHTETPDDDIFTEGINWGISYDLPNESKPALEPFLQLRRDEVKPAKKHGHQSTINAINKNAMKYSGWNTNDKYYVKPGKRKYHKSDYYYLQRRHRRELYSKLETIMNAMNFDGRTCMLRALCEASQRLMPKGSTLIEEMMRISFS